MSRIARSVSERGEVVLRRREHDDALELRVNGVFVMDNVETSSERALARGALDALEPSRSELTVLVGGLGLGFTVAELLAEPRVAHIVVAEIEPALVGWHEDGLVPDTADVLRDARTSVQIDDVRRVVASQPPASLDLLLLDVDNGPGYLVYDDNAAVYRSAFLQKCRARTRSGGVVVIWSSAESPDLAAAMREVFGSCDEVALPVRLGSRDTTYHLLIGRA